MDFIGFDGNNYNIPTLPANYYYEHFLVLLNKNNNYRILICFNGDLIECSISDKQMIFSSGDKPLHVFSVKSGYSTWSFSDTLVSYQISSSLEIIYSDEDFLPYKDIIITKDFSLDLSQLQASTFVLRPIVEEQNISAEVVFDEIFSILPVLIVVLIGFIGIRKGISWLFSLLRHS